MYTRLVKLMLAGCAALHMAAPARAQDPQAWRQPEPYVSAPAPDYSRSTVDRGNGYLGSQTGQYPNRQGGYAGANDAYRPPPPSYGAPPASQGYDTARNGGQGANDVYVLPPRQQGGQTGADRSDDAYRPPASAGDNRGYAGNSTGYGEPYQPPRQRYDADRRYDREGEPYRGPDARQGRTYSQNEVIDTGHRFFGSVSTGLAKAIEYVFQQSGRPNGYILGEDAGGAFIAGLRYGEGTLYTKDAGNHKVYWQGPSLGYDFGGEGSKTMVLVYNLRDPSEIYHRFGGVQGSAYLVGGVSVQFQKYGDVVLAPIRSGIGLRLGANVGYLKYTRRPTWNPF